MTPARCLALSTWLVLATPHCQPQATERGPVVMALPPIGSATAPSSTTPPVPTSSASVAAVPIPTSMPRPHLAPECEGDDLDIDALLKGKRCAQTKDVSAGSDGLGHHLRVSSPLAAVTVARNAWVDIPVWYTNPTAAPIDLRLQYCGLGHSLALGKSLFANGAYTEVLSTKGDQVDRVPGDNMSCLTGCGTTTLRVRIMPGGRARASVSFSPRMHRYMDCDQIPAGTLAPGTYWLKLDVPGPVGAKRASISLPLTVTSARR